MVHLGLSGIHAHLHGRPQSHFRRLTLSAMIYAPRVPGRWMGNYLAECLIYSTIPRRVRKQRLRPAAPTVQRIVSCETDGHGAVQHS
ncbi:hypothetical protein BDN70DRAFT_870698 [Pholiota conissans]|uniref:Uncharacterized protein n=1 Tax=Pholiota conissans TaxID=109636 RepID=A0A9P6CYZ2_9AGAR|nr:hypothetical protein BDN70DRAFT_870698 [Pholiota conissans]